MVLYGYAILIYKTIRSILLERRIYMGRISTKENKNIYQVIRENLELSREQASELLETITKEKIERIENEKCLPQPDDVKIMAEKYNEPDLRNYYCANQCPLGIDYVPEVKIKNLANIVLEMLSSLNSMDQKKNRLIEIAADGEISEDEMKDFVFIEKELEHISMTVDALQLWIEKMRANGTINKKLYDTYRNQE